MHIPGYFFLCHGSELRRCPIPSPVTLSTLKNLLVNTFDLRVSLLDDPMCYVMIQDRGSVQWKPLTDIRFIHVPIFQMSGSYTFQYSRCLVHTRSNIPDVWFIHVPIFQMSGSYTFQYSRCLVHTRSNIPDVWFIHVPIFQMSGSYTFQYSRCQVHTRSNIPDVRFIHVPLFTCSYYILFVSIERYMTTVF